MSQGADTEGEKSSSEGAGKRRKRLVLGKKKTGSRIKGRERIYQCEGKRKKGPEARGSRRREPKEGAQTTHGPDSGFSRN